MKRYINSSVKLNEYGELTIPIPEVLYDYNVTNQEILDFLTSFENIATKQYNMFIENRLFNTDGTLYIEVKPQVDLDALYRDIAVTLYHLVDEVSNER